MFKGPWWTGIHAMRSVWAIRNRYTTKYLKLVRGHKEASNITKHWKWEGPLSTGIQCGRAANFSSSWRASYVTTAMLDEDHKAFLISFSWSFIQHGGDSFVLYFSGDSWSCGCTPRIRHSGHLGGTSTKDFSLVSIVHSSNMAAGLLSFEFHVNDWKATIVRKMKYPFTIRFHPSVIKSNLTISPFKEHKELIKIIFAQTLRCIFIFKQ